MTRRPGRGSRPAWCTAGAAGSSSASTGPGMPCSRPPSWRPGPTSFRRRRSASEFARLQVIVDKTAGPREQEAMAMLTEYVRSPVASSSRRRPGCTSGCSICAGALGRRFGGLGAAVPCAVAAAGGAPALTCDRPRAPTRSGPRRSPSDSWPTTGSSGAPVSRCTAPSRRTAAWAPAPSSGWPWRAPWRSSTGCRPTPRVWRGRWAGASARRSAPGHSLWAASSWRAGGGRGGGRHRAAAGPSPHARRPGAAWWRCRAGSPGLSGEAESAAFERLPPPAGAGGRAGRPPGAHAAAPRAGGGRSRRASAPRSPRSSGSPGRGSPPAQGGDLRARAPPRRWSDGWRSGARRAWVRAPGDRRSMGWSGRRTGAGRSRRAQRSWSERTARFSRGDLPGPGPGSGGPKLAANRD